MIQLQDVTVGTNVMLAPMAGVTNPPFRQLCREFGEAGARAAGLDVKPGERTTGTEAPTGLYVCEMITSRALVERNGETMMMIQPDPGDPVRSIQLYGVEPKAMYEAARILVAEDWADHIDLNFGCPVPKVTRKGGGKGVAVEVRSVRGDYSRHPRGSDGGREGTWASHSCDGEVPYRDRRAMRLSTRLRRFRKRWGSMRSRCMLAPLLNIIRGRRIGSASRSSRG